MFLIASCRLKSLIVSWLAENHLQTMSNINKPWYFRLWSFSSIQMITNRIRIGFDICCHNCLFESAGFKYRAYLTNCMECEYVFMFMSLISHWGHIAIATINHNRARLLSLIMLFQLWNNFWVSTSWTYLSTSPLSKCDDKRWSTRTVTPSVDQDRPYEAVTLRIYIYIYIYICRTASNNEHIWCLVQNESINYWT